MNAKKESGCDVDDEVVVSGKRPLKPITSFIAAIKPRLTVDGERKPAEDGEESPWSYRLTPDRVDVITASVISRRRAVKKAVETTPGQDSDGVQADAIRIPDGPEEEPGEYISPYERDIQELRELSKDRIGFISRFRNLCEEKGDFLDELIKTLGSRPLTIYMPSVPAEDCQGWRMVADADKLQSKTRPKIRVWKGNRIIEVDLIDVLR